MPRLFLACLWLTIPAALLGQSAQFGVRGLGYPGRELSTRALASSGAFGLFDPESSLNPASLAGVKTLTAVFTMQRNSTSQENPEGSATVKDTRFPQVMVVGPVRQSGVNFGVSYSNYFSRDFNVATVNTVDIRGVPVMSIDSFSSSGGVSDLRLGGSYNRHNVWVFGAGFHVLTGSNRLQSRLSFADSTYLSSVQTSEVSYAGVGLSAGLIRQFGPEFAVAILARTDGHLNVDRDSTRVSQIDLPYSFGFGLHWVASRKLDLATQAMYRTWSGANSDILAQGGIGAENTFEAAFGAEYTTSIKSPYHWPLRLGGRYAKLPFPLTPGTQPHEVGVSGGSGMRFAQQRGGVDFTLEYVWRSEGVYSEHGVVGTLGISVRP